MAIQFGQNIRDYGGTGGENTPYWRQFSDTNAGWDYQQSPWDYSKVDFGEPPIPGATPHIDSTGNFAGWTTPDGMQWAPSGQFIGRGENQASYGDWQGQMGQALPGDLSVSPWMKYGTLGALAAMGGYGALAAGGALGAAGAAGGAGGAAAPVGMAAGEGAMLGGGIAPLTYGGAGGMVGGVGTAAGGAAAGSVPWSSSGTAAESLWPGSSLSGGASTGLTPEIASSLGLSPSGVPLAGGGGGGFGYSDIINGAQKVAGAGSSLTGGNRTAPGGMGGLLGGLIGGGLGYLDAKSQPDSLTIKNEIDPRLAQYAYGADGNSGIAGAANTLMQQQMAGPNPLTQAGQQISGMANTLPNWNSLVGEAKGQWDANPFIKDQQNAITGMATRNLMENVIPGIGSNANMAGGYGGSRQGIAQGLAMSRLNQDLAPALTGLASNAWESGQNRALNSAQSAGSYGLNNQAQQAGLLGTGASLQAQGPWNPIQNATNVMGSLPGNTSQTQPLFNNPYAGALGGASVGSQIGGGTNWGDIFKGIGGIGDLWKNWGTGN